MFANLLRTPKEIQAMRRVVLVDWLREDAEEARKAGSRYQMDNRTYSANKAFDRWRKLEEIAKLLEQGPPSPPTGPS